MPYTIVIHGRINIFSIVQQNSAPGKWKNINAYKLHTSSTRGHLAVLAENTILIVLLVDNLLVD